MKGGCIALNPFIVSVGVLQFLGGIWQMWKRDWRMGAVYLMFGLCSLLMSKVSGK